MLLLQRFSSILQGFSFMTGTGILCSFAYSISHSRVRFSSRIGATTSRPAIRKMKSNRSWSFPLPVHPWATVLAFSRRATRTTSSAIRGLASAVPIGYPS